MKFNITIKKVTTVEEIAEYWQHQDYIKLLELFNFPDAADVKPESLKEMLQMAINDFEPEVAARIVLDYKLSERLNEDQIHQVSNDMLIDKISEEYPEINLHYDLYNINQLLFKAYNGKFPNTKATIVDFSMVCDDDFDEEITKEMVLKSFRSGISDRNLIKRLFEEQMTTDIEFEKAEFILWELSKKGEADYTLITSAYWLSKDDFTAAEFEGECLLPEEVNEDDN
ncbi:MAG: hypothetical protein LAT67_12385 [Balneolales bacterium]|nr:hypothetical protein [Balneolales bacterium]